jgi:hypothetical protein
VNELEEAYCRRVMEVLVQGEEGRTPADLDQVACPSALVVLLDLVVRHQGLHEVPH